MKKVYILLLFFIFVLIVLSVSKTTDEHRVIKIISADAFYIDFNDNGIADENELTELYYVRKIKKGSYSPVDCAKLSYLADNYAVNTLQNKLVKAVFDERHRLKTVIFDGADYSQMLVRKGYAIANTAIAKNPYSDIKNGIEITNNIAAASKLNLVSYNQKSGIFHKLECEHAFSSVNYIIIEEKNLPPNSKKCKHCYALRKQDEPEIYPKFISEEYKPVYKTKYIELYATDFTKYFFTNNRCMTAVCKSLLSNINSAKETIDFAVYGVYNEPQIVNALKKAKKRGVKVRWVYDLDGNGNSVYSHTKNTVVELSNARSDVDNRYAGSIMHNKFFIFDNNSVWTGSANISDTDLSGFNANTVLLIKSPVVASVYKKEFEQMYSGAFHKDKIKTVNNENIKLENTEVSVYFSPQDKPLKNKILPLVQNAKKYIYIPVFIITDKNLVNALKNASSRGVDVRILTDATGAANRYSPVDEMRSAGLKIKIENRAGKMHSKAIVIDDLYLIVGSMNFSKSGENYNDENLILIKDKNFASAYKQHFLHLWKNIPDKWLYKNPGAESKNSVNSCYDGIDNDYDGKIDAEDSMCR